MPKLTSFETNIASPDAPVSVDFDDTRPVLLIAFGGLAGKLGMPVFEFFNITSRLSQVNKIFLRDRRHLWYQAGLSGIGSDPASIAGYLRQYTDHPCTERVIAVGNSGGGYAALLFGHMLGVDEVHAFSPKTSLHVLWRIAALDPPPRRHIRQMATLWLFHRRQSRYFDLKKRLIESPAEKTQFHVYFSSGYRPDRVQATRMQAVPGVCLHPYATQGHDLIRQLKQSGELSQIVERAIQC